MENQIYQSKYFGSSTHVYNVAEMKRLLGVNIEKAKQYFLTYFCKTMDNTCFYYEPQDDGSQYIESKENLKGIYKNIKNPSFNVQNWFEQDVTETFKLNSNPMAPRFYKSDVTGQCYINLSKGFLWTGKKSYKDFPDEIKAKVDFILKHIKTVWNSGVDEAFEYVLNWCSCALTGHKMPTALFLKSGEGTGKSIIVEFFINHVIGEALGYSTSRSSQLPKFNAQLLGKILVCLEEMPSGSKSEWHSITDYLKDLITGSKLEIERKYSDAMQVANLISLIIITNNDNSIRFGKDCRRYFMCDISHDFVGNSKYFKELGNCLTKDVGEAFYYMLSERYETINHTFNPDTMPLTDAKLDIKEKNSTHILNYIKNHYVTYGLGIDAPVTTRNKKGMMKLADLKDRINQTYSLSMSTQSFRSSLQCDIPIIKSEQYGEKKEYHIVPISADALKKFYIEKGFWNNKFDVMKCKDDFKKSVFNKDKDNDLEDDDDEYVNPDKELHEKVTSLETQNKDMLSIIERLQKELMLKQEQDLEEVKVIEVIEVVKPKTLKKRISKKKTTLPSILNASISALVDDEPDSGNDDEPPKKPSKKVVQTSDELLDF